MIFPRCHLLDGVCEPRCSVLPIRGLVPAPHWRSHPGWHHSHYSCGHALFLRVLMPWMPLSPFLYLKLPIWTATGPTLSCQAEKEDSSSKSLPEFERVNCYFKENIDGGAFRHHKQARKGALRNRDLGRGTQGTASSPEGLIAPAFCRSGLRVPGQHPDPSLQSFVLTLPSVGRTLTVPCCTSHPFGHSGGLSLPMCPRGSLADVFFSEPTPF